jgi:hypothetical protein
MIRFNFKLFLDKNRKSLADLSRETQASLPSLSIMRKRGTIKPSFLAVLESQFGDCTTYILNNKKK